jgi:hypothetical protein
VCAVWASVRSSVFEFPSVFPPGSTSWWHVKDIPRACLPPHPASMACAIRHLAPTRNCVVLRWCGGPRSGLVHLLVSNPHDIVPSSQRPAYTSKARTDFLRRLLREPTHEHRRAAAKRDRAGRTAVRAAPPPKLATCLHTVGGCGTTRGQPPTALCCSRSHPPPPIPHPPSCSCPTLPRPRTSCTLQQPTGARKRCKSYWMLVRPACAGVVPGSWFGTVAP